MPWDPSGAHHDVVPDAIPIPHSERHKVIAALRNAGAAGDREQGSSDENRHKPAPATKDASTMTDPQKRCLNYDKPASPHLDSHHSQHQGGKVMQHNTERKSLHK